MVMSMIPIVILTCLIAQAQTQCTTTGCENGRSCDERLLTLSDQVSLLKYRLSAVETSVRTLSTQSSPGVSPSRDCADIKAQGNTGSGIYIVYYLDGTTWTPLRVYCDMETAGGGWLVFQRRQDGSEDFYRNWANYTDGFGDPRKEFWLGNNQIHLLTSSGQYKLRIDLEDFEGEMRYAEWSTFSVGDASSKYTLTVSRYSGDAGDGLTWHNGMKFSTKDQDNDLYEYNCATVSRGAWWYKYCAISHLNGQYRNGSLTVEGRGINWREWKGHNYSLKFAEMKIKPT